MFGRRILAGVAYVVVGLAFGAADRSLGTIRFGPWAWTVSAMSAPWLVLPFVVGMPKCASAPRCR
jgi:hypothetical protein